jgi:hypothetical protein
MPTMDWAAIVEYEGSALGDAAAQDLAAPWRMNGPTTSRPRESRCLPLVAILQLTPVRPTAGLLVNPHHRRPFATGLNRGVIHVTCCQPTSPTLR